MKLLPRILIDNIKTDTQESISHNGEVYWVIAKPLEFSGLVTYLTRIRNAWEVLLGKQIAVEYMRDRIKRKL